MPRPLKKRAARNWPNVFGMAESKPDTAYSSAQRKSIFRRPKRSLKKPANIAPGTQPAIALAPAMPSWAAFKFMCSLR